ncbi:transposase, partial [Mycobacterium ulcerans]
RQHCGIENSLHWIRDVTFDEDRQRPHTGNGAQVLATLRNTAINLHPRPCRDGSAWPVWIRGCCTPCRSWSRWPSW